MIEGATKSDITYSPTFFKLLFIPEMSISYKKKLPDVW